MYYNGKKITNAALVFESDNYFKKKNNKKTIIVNANKR